MTTIRLDYHSVPAEQLPSWAALSSLLTTQPRTDETWRDGARLLGEIHELESRLFETLGDRTGK